MSKAVIIGNGFVGSAIAYTIALKKLMGQVVLIDINTELAEGEAMDIADGAALFGFSQIKYGTFQECRDADIIVITAGVNRKADQTREELLGINQKIMSSILENIRPYYNDSFVLIVSNPVDQLTGFAFHTGFIAKNKICGTGCLLDTSRWLVELSKYLKVETDRIETYAVGIHGAGQQLLWERTKVNGEKIENYCAMNDIVWNDSVKQEMHLKVTQKGAEIIRRKGKTQYGIAASVAYFISCIIGIDYTTISVGNILESDVCSSSLVKAGNYEIISISGER